MTDALPARVRRLVDWALVLAWITDNIRIQDRRVNGEPDVAITPNRGQILAAAHPAFSLLGGWLIAVKARQIGFTTFCLCWAMALMVLYPGVSIAFVAPEDVIKGPLQPKWSIIWRSAAASMGKSWPGVWRDNEQTFWLNNGSRIVWVSAGNTREKASKASLGDTIDFVILSEMAKWPFARVTLQVLIPALKRPSVVVDSTPPEQEGMGRDYLEMATAALRGELRGRSVMFFPWYWEAEYRASYPALDLTDEERALGLDPFQIAWRREQKASPEIGPIFDQVYPETIDLALTPPGESAFPMDLTVALRRRTNYPPPLTELEVHAALPEWLRAPLPGSDELCQPHWGEPSRRGYVRIWERPRPGVRYWAGLDGADGGLYGGDWQALAILDEGGALVAQLRMRIPVLRLASHIARLCWWYNEATIEVEMMACGPAVIFYLTSTPPDDEIKVHRAHPALQRAYPRGKIIRRVADRIAQVDRKDSFVDYFSGGREVRDPETAREILALDPETREKKKVRGASDDILDSIGIAASSRKRATFKRARVAATVVRAAAGRPKAGRR